MSAALLFVLATNGAVAEPPVCGGGPEPAVQVQVPELKDRSGTLRLELYPATAQDFLRDDDALLKEGKPFRRTIKAPPMRGPATLCVTAPHPGRYAIVLIHNRDGRPAFNISQDGVALPRNQRIGYRRPGVEQAIVDVLPGGTTVAMRMQYLKGLSGFVPVATR